MRLFTLVARSHRRLVQHRAGRLHVRSCARRVDRRPAEADARATSLALYAALEVFIAVAAIALPAALSFFEPVLAWAYADGDAPARFSLVRTGHQLRAAWISGRGHGRHVSCCGLMVCRHGRSRELVRA